MPNIKGKYIRIVLTFLVKCDKKRISELNMCNRYSVKVHTMYAEKRIRCESGAMPSLYMGVVFRATGIPGRESSDERSQENCLSVEKQDCGSQTVFS